MTRPVTRIEDPRLVKALAHPLRVRILGLLDEKVMTPKQIAATLGLRLENVSYHVRILRDFGFIKLERKKQVRGAVEHHYRAVERPQITPKVWDALPTAAQEAMASAPTEVTVFQVGGSDGPYYATYSRQKAHELMRAAEKSDVSWSMTTYPLAGPDQQRHEREVLDHISAEVGAPA